MTTLYIEPVSTIRYDKEKERIVISYGRTSELVLARIEMSASCAYEFLDEFKNAMMDATDDY